MSRGRRQGALRARGASRWRTSRHCRSSRCSSRGASTSNSSMPPRSANSSQFWRIPGVMAARSLRRICGLSLRIWHRCSAASSAALDSSPSSRVSWCRPLSTRRRRVRRSQASRVCRLVNTPRAMLWSILSRVAASDSGSGLPLMTRFCGLEVSLVSQRRASENGGLRGSSCRVWSR